MLSGSVHQIGARKPDGVGARVHANKLWIAYYTVGTGKNRVMINGYGATKDAAIAAREARLKRRLASSDGFKKKTRSVQLSEY